MDKPLSTWYCDVCDEKITNVKDGYVIWNTDQNIKASNFKIIHKKKCDKRDYIASAALNDFLGVEGLTYLLSKHSLGPIFLNNGQQSHCQITDFDGYTDLFRRVQIPFYEEARLYFDNIKLREKYADFDECSPYLPEQLEKVIREFGGN